MTQVITILFIVGIIVFLLGIASFINPNIARFINLPGSSQIKAIIATIIGVFLIIIGLLVQ